MFGKSLTDPFKNEVYRRIDISKLIIVTDRYLELTSFERKLIEVAPEFILAILNVKVGGIII